MNHISAGHLAFDQLPPKLKQAATQGVLSVLVFRVRLERQNGRDPTPLIQEVGRALASTSGATPTLSPLSLLWGASNLGVEDVRDVLGALGVKDAWNQLGQVASRAGFHAVDLRTAFLGLARDRHAAAHEAQTDTPLLSVRSLARSALAIGLAFDVLLSRAGRLCHSGDAGYLAGQEISSDDIALIFVDDRGGSYAVIAEGSTRAHRVFSSVDEALQAAVPFARVRSGVVVQRTRGHDPMSWYTTDLP